MRAWYRFGLVCALALASASAQGQTPDPARAQKLFDEARALVKAGKYPGACPKFAESYGLDPAFGTLMNLADCEEHINKLLDARQHWRQLLHAMPVSGDPRRQVAQQHLDDLQKKIPQLTLWLAPGAPPSTVTRDGVELAPTMLGVADDVDPGMHEVIVRSPGYSEKKYLVTVHASQHLDQVVEPGARQATPPFTVPTAPPTTQPTAPPVYPPIAPAQPTARPPAPTVSAKPTATPAPKPPEPKESKESTTTHKLGHWGIGLGATTMGVGVIMGGLALMKKVSLADSCPDHHCPEDQRENYDTARGLAAWSTGTMIVGGVLLAGGIVLVSLPQGSSTKESTPASPAKGRASSSSTPSLTVGAGPGQVSIQGWF